MLAFAIASALAIAVAALAYLRPTPARHLLSEAEDPLGMISGMSRRRAFVLLCLAGFLCCTPMAMPLGHVVALCSDLGIAPARGALMLSVLLGSAFISRLFWGWLSDTVGGLHTVLAGSICQAAAMVGFVVTQNEAGLFAVAAAFGLGFSGIIPAYVVVLRDVFPASEASWRIPIWFFSNICGMALGGWLAGYIYDVLGSYGPAFIMGVMLNLANIAVIGLLAARRREVQTRSAETP
jgi:MFS family permease